MSVKQLMLENCEKLLYAHDDNTLMPDKPPQHTPSLLLPPSQAALLKARFLRFRPFYELAYGTQPFTEESPRLLQ